MCLCVGGAEVGKTWTEFWKTGIAVIKSYSAFSQMVYSNCKGM